nr:MAG TPA: hypothetical protein [Caudoviricetes sp.]DAZ29133.1 MAG TPA: hypothetical protein [Caudoviricetes sp.]
MDADDLTVKDVGYWRMTVQLKLTPKLIPVVLKRALIN